LKVNDTDTAMLLRDGMLVMLKLGGPPLLVALAVGLLVALLQAVTQINEATLAFVPKVLALCAALMVLGPFMLSTLSSYTHTLMDRLIVIGGS
jgi:flagellar biosynthetic protein FliQ